MILKRNSGKQTGDVDARYYLKFWRCKLNNSDAKPGTVAVLDVDTLTAARIVLR